jgi:hypothetical protein
MFAAVCARYSEIAKTQVKLTLRINLLLAVTVLFITPVIFGLNNLDNTASAFVLERFVSLTGIIMLTPVFLPEQDKNISELVESKYTPMTGVYLIRFILAAVSLLFMISGFIFIMILMSCEFGVFKFIFGTFSTAFFLGALGFIAYAISDNIVAGYLLSLGYYVFNMFSSSEQLKNKYLFTLAQNRLTEKYWLFGIGMTFSIAGVLFRYISGKTR